MGEKPAGMTLDRINSSGNYTPENCRWTTPEQQSQNRRPYKPQTKGRGSSKYINVNWDPYTNKWEARVRHNGREKHLGRYDKEEDAAQAVQAFRQGNVQ
jgi:hypothetical protein